MNTQELPIIPVQRIEICNSCEFKKTTLKVNTCGVCGCLLKGKIFSPNVGACPRKKWGEIDQKMYFKLGHFVYHIIVVAN